MKVELLVIDGCPHAKAAAELIATALERSGRPQGVPGTFAEKTTLSPQPSALRSPSRCSGIHAVALTRRLVVRRCRVVRTLWE
jgi:hypothetical protein